MPLNKPKTELLAPAGNLSCALAAFDAGADAVYAGLKQFNARERTENFTFAEMSKLLSFAHKNGKKVFVTLNTLIKESELPALADYLAELAELRPDALIVQDLGVVRLVREYFPELMLHGSTQMGLHNSAGLAFAKGLGLKRVILERQTTITELERMMSSKPPVEVEVFIHGALCCCISGSCLLSSWLGGWSGNRGKCKQPCRRRYHGADGNGFFLSSQDLCTLELLPRILATGVASLKIEGRLRRADYVTNTVSAYRMALDAASDPEKFRSVLSEAKELLSHTCGRKWSQGFYTPESARSLIKHDAMGASGLLCGKVISRSHNGFTISVMRRLHLGDVIRVQPQSGDEGPAISITKMSSPHGGELRCARKDETCFIHSDKEVADGAFVYKTGESVADYTRRIAAMPEQKTLLDLDVTLSRQEITIRAPGFTWHKELDLQEAASHPASADTLRSEFAGMNFPSFAPGLIRAEVSGSPFLPASVLKALRNEFRDALERELTPDRVRDSVKERLEKFRSDYALLRKPGSFELKDTVILPRGHKAPSGDFTIAREIPDAPSPHEELILPFFIPETKLESVRAALEKFISKGGHTVRITSVHHLALLRNYPGLTVKTLMPLPVCNSFAAYELKVLGVSAVQGWLELEKEELENLAQHCLLPLEQYRYGRPVLLSTRAAIPAEGTLTDARGNEFRIRHNDYLTQLTADKVMLVPAFRGADASLLDLRFAAPGETDSATFNFDHTLS